MRRAISTAAAVVLAAAATGCGGTTVAGKVSYRGRAVTSGSVIALSEDGTAQTGVIRPDGTYAVEGVKPGRVRFGVFSPDPVHARSILTGHPHPPKDKHGKPTHTAAATPGWFPIPKELGDPEK